MLSNNRRTLLLALLLAGSPMAMAHAADAGGSVKTVVKDEVVVTGSHLRQTGVNSPVPLTVVGATQLQDMAPTTLVEGVTQLPEFYASQTPQSGGWFTRAGYGDLNIRGLGVNRTLTLLDGRRVISQNAFGGVDINMFPQEMIKSVEVVTGGASAAYGTDAVAGVANFILDTNFTGFRITGQGGETTRGDGGDWQASGAFGMHFADDKGHVLIAGEMFKQDGIFTYKGRDWYKAWGTVVGPGGELLIRPDVVSTGSTFGGLIYAPGTPLNGLAFAPNGSTYQFQASSVASGAIGTAAGRQSIANGGSGDDLGGGSIPTLDPNLERYSAFAYVDYDLAPNFKVFVQGLHGVVSTLAYNTPEGSLQGSPTAVTIFSGNPYLPANVQQIMTNNNIASFVLRETGAPGSFGGNDTLRDTSVMNSATAGFKWNIQNAGFFNDWNVDGYYQYGHNTRNMYQVGLNLLHMFAAVDAVKNGSGQIVCRTSLSANPLPGCTPIDLFGVGNASPAALSYVTGETPGLAINTPVYFAGTGYSPPMNLDYTSQLAKVNITTMQQHVAELSMNGQVFQGWGAGPITAAFGGSFRRESILQLVEDPTNPPGDQTNGRPIPCNGSAAAIASGLRGISGPDCANTVGIQYSKVSNILGAIETKEIYGETGIPLIANAPFMRMIKLDLAGRWADYSGSGGIWAYKAGASWDVVDGLRLRGTYSRDVRAANLSERFDKTGGAGTATDPLHPGAGVINITTYSGGNPTVKPEKADTFTAGAVLQPRFIPGSSFSVDWYRIKINGAIGQLGAQNVINQCAAGATALCALVTRDTVTDLPILVGNVYVNINEALVRGVDFEANYTRDVHLFGGGPESISGRFFGSWLLENSQQLNGAPKIDRAGQVGIQQSDGVAYALPRFKFTASVSYDNGPFEAFVQGRFISSGTLENAAVVGTTIESNYVPPIFYTDLTLRYRLKTVTQTELFFTVTNLFDVDPPVTPYYSTFSDYSIQDNPTLYDVLGRRFVVGATLRF